MDILGKPYNWQTPRLDIWLSNLAPEPCTPVLNAWQRHVIDANAALDGDLRITRTI